MANDSDHSDDDVGYGKPPRRTRFKPGRSGNPRGRSRHSKDISTLFKRQLDRHVKIMRDNREVRVTMLEYLVMKIVMDASKGDARARDITFKYVDESGKPDPIGFKLYDDTILKELAVTLQRPDSDGASEE